MGIFRDHALVSRCPNAGVAIDGSLLGELFFTHGSGVFFLGLVIGKQIGVGRGPAGWLKSSGLAEYPGRFAASCTSTVRAAWQA